jgi:hypothetical protein
MTKEILAMADDLPWADAPKMTYTAAPVSASGDAHGEMAGQLSTVAAVRRFIEAGNATLTVRSLRTGKRLTFKFTRPDEEPGKDRPIWVKLLSGADNTSDYQFLGTLWADATLAYRYRHSAKSRVSMSAPAVLALQWLVKALTRGESELAKAEVWHEGMCGRCGRKLTVPESIESGFGPECIKHIG